MLYIIIFLASLSITILALPYLINFLTRMNIIDSPGGIRINTNAVPRMGGILIYVIIIMAILNFTEDIQVIRFMLTASGIIAICGMLDDRSGLGWHAKYIMQSVSAGIFLIYLYPLLKQVEFFGIVLPFPFDLAILFFLITGSVNALNLLDGMDGLASGFSLLVFMVIGILSFIYGSSFLVILSAAAVGSLSGFLKFNAPPAKVYLGDTGSMVLGFFLIVSAILFMNVYNARSLDLTFPIILLGVPLIDTLKVMAIRYWNGRSIFSGDYNHIHHLISGNNIKVKTTVLIIHLFTVFFTILSVGYLFYDKSFAVILFSIAGIMMFMIKPVIQLFRKSIRIYGTQELSKIWND